jgi:nitroreductase
MPTPNFVPLEGHVRRPDAEMLQRAGDFREEMARRRTVRRFAPDPVPLALIEECLRTAGTAPSGANMQPWHFAVVTDAERKRQIRDAAEAEERAFYAQRATPEWLAALLPLGTDDNKPYLEIAPVLIGVFVQRFGLGPDGERVPHYYATESVGLATGFLIAALHHAGLATLTHTPSPMGFLNELMGRPPEERPFVLLVAGHPAPDVEVPAITRKPLAEIASFL